MEKFTKNLIVLSLFVLCGCASNSSSTDSRWYQTGKTPKETQQDLAACRLLAEQNNNPLEMVNAGFFLANQIHHNRVVEDCMITKGYTLLGDTNAASTDLKPPKMVK